MSLSNDNKVMLKYFHDIGIDVDQFSDKTFDGLFCNSCPEMKFFFDWMVKNVTQDNIFTKEEEVIYLKMDTSNSLPDPKEVNIIITSSNINYEELCNLNKIYINRILPEALNDLETNSAKLNSICSDLQSNHFTMKKKIENTEKTNKAWENKLAVAIQKNTEINALYEKILNEVKMVLLKNPGVCIDVSSFKELELDLEIKIFDILESFSKIKTTVFTSSTDLNFFLKLQEHLVNIETSIALSEISLKGKEAKLKCLEDIYGSSDKKSLHHKLIEFGLNEDSLKKSEAEYESAEKVLKKNVKEMAFVKVQEIREKCLSQAINFNKISLENLSLCKNFLSLSGTKNSQLLHMLKMFETLVSKKLHTRTELSNKLRKDEAEILDGLSAFEMKILRYKEISNTANQHPFLLAFQNLLSSDDISKLNNTDVTCQKINALLSQSNENSLSRYDLKSAVRSLLYACLYGPTSQILMSPVDLLIKSQQCEGRNVELTQEIKQISKEYLEAKVKLR